MGTQIRKARREHLSLTQHELADRLIKPNGKRGIEQVNVSRWELDKAEPSVRYVRQIAELAGLPVAWFYATSEEEAAVA